MSPRIVFDRDGIVLWHGDARDVLPKIGDCSASSVVTDPPYELGFMGKSWDSTGIAYDVPLWRECLRTLKHGGHLVAFGGTRTSHRMTSAIEDAGFEIRDAIVWLYGQGFPKSFDVSKALDKAAGEEREIVPRTRPDGKGTGYADSSFATSPNVKRSDVASTPAAREWSGWGTALKPAHEPATLARKPLIGTVAANVQAHGAGAINVDGCRIGTTKRCPGSPKTVKASIHTVSLDGYAGGTGHDPNVGRWPANVLVDEDAALAIDMASGHLHGPGAPTHGSWAGDGMGYNGSNAIGRRIAAHREPEGGGASRFFYTSKASRGERDGNTHPTVKPLDLMRWLCRLVTPPGGLVVEPFAGSGTTLCAAYLEGFRAVGVEREEKYVEIIIKRLEAATAQRDLFARAVNGEE